MYAKLTDGILEYAPREIILGGRRITNPSAAQLAAAGFMPVVYTAEPEPTDGEAVVYYAASWEVQDGEIVCVWNETDPPELPAPTIAERVQELEK